jgi:hypothetical protein
MRERVQRQHTVATLCCSSGLAPMGAPGMKTHARWRPPMATLIPCSGQCTVGALTHTRILTIMLPPGAELVSWHGTKKMHEPRATTCTCVGLALAAMTLPISTPSQGGLLQAPPTGIHLAQSSPTQPPSASTTSLCSISFLNTEASTPTAGQSTQPSQLATTHPAQAGFRFAAQPAGQAAQSNRPLVPPCPGVTNPPPTVPPWRVRAHRRAARPMAWA